MSGQAQVLFVGHSVIDYFTLVIVLSSSIHISVLVEEDNNVQLFGSSL